jgi:hypothetical protein
MTPQLPSHYWFTLQVSSLTNANSFDTLLGNITAGALPETTNGYRARAPVSSIFEFFLKTVFKSFQKFE